MGLLHVAAAVLALGQAALASPVPAAEAVAAATKYCDATTTVCYSEYTTPEKIAFRIAIPDNATAGNFDVLLQIVAPKAIGWAGIAWGGAMTNNPLTVAWAASGKSVVTGRKASARTYPAVDPAVSYTVLGGSTANATHWTLNALAKGISAWGTTKLDPASTAVTLAYAHSATAPTSADPTSRFGIHSGHAKWTQDLSSAKIADFGAAVTKVSGTAASKF
ncbi:hypothetical protein B0T19DRAFT_403861 [Cercophora scortea]|uniref:Cellobiose dehydrogenase-like cytochrome domain-containing protein n=1 Tax=Cercophora scortea TaxID=314031 RepID=A0AAE0IA07_9PEZI|nr:hypothetical protein B0T19DRAFT_403861 [Cercophora scortea]